MYLRKGDKISEEPKETLAIYKRLYSSRVITILQ